MEPTAHEGPGENEEVELPSTAHPPEHAEEVIVLPDLETARPFRIMSPHLTNPEQASDFVMKVIDES